MSGQVKSPAAAGTPVSTTDLEGCGGLRLRADVLGDPDGQPVVMFHGGGQTRHMWSAAAAALAAQGSHVYNVDQRGHGDSEWSADGAYALDDFAADVRAIARSLPRPPVLIGLSMGARACICAAGDPQGPPLASGVVVVEAGVRLEQSGVSRIVAFMKESMSDGFASLEELAASISTFGGRRRPSNPEGLRRHVRQREDGRWYWHWDPRYIDDLEHRDDDALTARVTTAARNLTVPVLLVRGGTSDVFTPEAVAEFRHHVPHAEFVEVPGVGHSVAGQDNDVFNSAVIDFVGRLVRTDATGPL